MNTQFFGRKHKLSKPQLEYATSVLPIISDLYPNDCWVALSEHVARKYGTRPVERSKIASQVKYHLTTVHIINEYNINLLIKTYSKKRQNMPLLLSLTEQKEGGYTHLHQTLWSV